VTSRSTRRLFLVAALAVAPSGACAQGDPARQQALGHAAQDRAQKIYSLEASVARFESLYDLEL